MNHFVLKVIIQNSNLLLMNSRPLKYVLLISLHSISLLYLKWKGYFRFPFYGHEVDKVYVTTDGFLSLSSRIHGFIYKIQYIAPLRLKLDPSLSEESEISYKLTENNLTVEWKRMRLPNASSKKQGETTFQVRDFMEILLWHKKIHQIFSPICLTNFFHELFSVWDFILSRHLKNSSDVFTN